MLGIGSTELLVIMVVALIVLGPKNLPKIAQTLGKAMGEFRRYSTEFQRTLNTEIAFEEHKEDKAKTEKEQSEAAQSTAQASASVITSASVDPVSHSVERTEAPSPVTSPASSGAAPLVNLEVPNPSGSASGSSSGEVFGLSAEASAEASGEPFRESSGGDRA